MEPQLTNKTIARHQPETWMVASGMPAAAKVESPPNNLPERNAI